MQMCWNTREKPRTIGAEFKVQRVKHKLKLCPQHRGIKGKMHNGQTFKHQMSQRRHMPVYDSGQIKIYEWMEDIQSKIYANLWYMAGGTNTRVPRRRKLIMR